MALPTSLTFTTAADYAVLVLGPTATALGWVAASGAVVEAVNDSVYQMETTDPALVVLADLPKLRAAIRYQAWYAAVEALASRHDFTSDGQSMSLGQLQAEAVIALGMAEERAAVYGLAVRGSGVIGVTVLSYDEDPYAVAALTEGW